MLMLFVSLKWTFILVCILTILLMEERKAMDGARNGENPGKLSLIRVRVHTYTYLHIYKSCKYEYICIEFIH